MYQVFIQDGKTIEVPAPNVEGIPSDSNKITSEMCTAAPIAFDDRDRFNEVGGYSQLDEALAIPMVLVMSIWSDVSLPSLTSLSLLTLFPLTTIPLPQRKREIKRPMSANERNALALRQHALARLHLSPREGGPTRRRPRLLPPGLRCSRRGYRQVRLYPGHLVQHPLRSHRLHPRRLTTRIHSRGLGFLSSFALPSILQFVHPVPFLSPYPGKKRAIKRVL